MFATEARLDDSLGDGMPHHHPPRLEVGQNLLDPLFLRGLLGPGQRDFRETSVLQRSLDVEQNAVLERRVATQLFPGFLVYFLNSEQRNFLAPIAMGKDDSVQSDRHLVV